MKEYLTLFEAFSTVCKKKDELQEAYDAMYRDLRERTNQVRLLREELAEAKQEAESWKAKFKAASDLYWDNRRSADWISVKDRLPSGGHNVLFCTVDGNVCEGVKMASGWNGFRWNVIYQDSAVSHWMPLPEPPEVHDAENS